jgi:hypothetical protein
MATRILSTVHNKNNFNGGLMGRKPIFKEIVETKVRFEKSDYVHLKEIAYVESLVTGKEVHISQLIRDAVNFVYKDGERMREVFRRSRMVAHRFKNTDLR